MINKGIKDVTYIHSDLQQEHRELAVSEFKSGKFRIIIATDVMGRGIDVDDVAHVINYDVPKEAADYIHRIGRTGRRGLTGRASTFAIPGKDDKSISAIEKLRGVPAPKKPLPREKSNQQEPRVRRHVPTQPKEAPVAKKVVAPEPAVTKNAGGILGKLKSLLGIFRR